MKSAPSAPRIARSLSPRKRLVFALAAMGLSLALCLAVAEAGLRLANPLGLRERASWHYLLWDCIQPSADPELVWEHRPGVAERLVGYDVRINSLGFRGEEVAERKAPGSLRIMAVGDSMTFGMSGRQEDCYPEQLQALLRRQAPGRQAEVINTGVLGYTTLQEEALLRRWLPRLKPDLVVLWWFHNDVVITGKANPASQAEQLRYLIGYKEHDFKGRLVHACYQAAPALMALARSVTVGRGDRDQTHFEFRPEREAEGWRLNMASLKRIAAFCREQRVPLVIYSFGNYEQVATIAQEEHVPYLTSVERAGREHEAKYAVASTDPHFNREGNRVVAETVLKGIGAFLGKNSGK